MPEPLRVLVLEDEWPARNYLVQLLEQSGLAHVVAAVPTPALATEALAASPAAIDAAFVDVHLAEDRVPARAGLRWIESIRTRGEEPAQLAAPLVVLTTAMTEHAMRAFELGVVDYLLKPFTERRVRATLERLGAFAQKLPARTQVPTDVRIAARKGRSVVFLARAEAFAFEADGRLCSVHSTAGRLDVDLSLTSLEAVLGPSYLRVHRSWLVSLEHVRSFERDAGELVLLVGPGDTPLRVHVARDRAVMVRERLLASAVGLRRDGGP